MSDSVCIAEFPRSDLRRFRYTEFVKMVDLGLFENDRVELIDGHLLKICPICEKQTVVVLLTRQELEGAFGANHTVRPRLPLGLPQLDSCPEPELAVVVGGPRDYREFPTTANLVVEVSASTLTYDLGPKAVLYALGAIPEYWVIDVNAREVVVHRDPKAGRYQTIFTLPEGEQVQPLLGQKAIAVASMLP